MLRLFGLTAVAGVLAAATPAPSQVTSEPSVTVEGTAFHVALPNGVVLAQEQLPGTVLGFGDGSGVRRRLRIDSVERDFTDPAGEVILYGLSEVDSVSGEWRTACNPDPDGRRLGFPLAGAFAADGTYQPAHGGLLITCTGGAEGKCIRFGYKPWRTTADGTSLASYYQACVRLVRADYGGDGIGHTRNGTPIDLFDRIGIQSDEPGPGMSLEAAFDPNGAVCVAHTRLAALLTLDMLVEQYPRLAGHLGAACDETAPALLFVRSLGR